VERLAALAPCEVPPEPEPLEPVHAALDAVRRRDAAQAAVQAAEEELAAATRLLDAVGERSALAQAVIETGLGPLAQAASALLGEWGRQDAVSLAPLGLVRGERTVPWDGCSSGERTELALALGLAMLDRVKPPLRLVLVDNAECLDPLRLSAVLAGLRRARDAGLIHYAVVAGVLAEVPDGWEVHRL